MEPASAALVSQNPLAKRLLWSAVLVSITVYLIFSAPFFIFFAGVEVVIFLSLNEFFTLVERKGLPVNRLLGLIFGVLIPFNYFFPTGPAVILLAILALFLAGFDRNSPATNNSLVVTAITLFGLMYIGWMTAYLLKLRTIPETGAWWVFFVIFVVKMGDAGAYFVGKKWGRHKLIEHISPNKSIEGALGFVTVTILCSLLSKIYLPSVPLIHLFILGAILSVLAQLGDLAESLIKRNLGAKDSGAIPGLGGMLDVMDSLLFSIPVVYYYLTAVPGALG